MKTDFQLEIPIALTNTFFPHERIKTKLQVLKIQLEACRLILYADRLDSTDEVNRIVVSINKMSRLFFFSERKSYSINFPFAISDNDDDDVLIYHNSGVTIDSKIISMIYEVIDDPKFLTNDCLEFADFIDDVCKMHTMNIWGIIFSLLISEDGYLRYDEDKDGFERAKSNGIPDHHPLHHVDLFYTSSSSFKIGLRNRLLHSNFISLVDNDKECMYLQ